MVPADSLPLRFRPATHPPGTLARLPVQQMLAPDPAEAIDRLRLVLLCAPAGFGKTTLLAQLAQAATNRGVRIAWLNCEARDRDARVLREGLLQTVRHAGIEPPSLEARASIDSPLWLLLDAFERADSAPSCAVLEELVRQAGPQLRLVVATRELPRLPLTQMMLQGRARQIDAGMLRFSDAEARQLLGSTVAPEHLDAVVRYADGWPFALQLAHLRAQALPTLAGPRPLSAPIPRQQIFDYLAREVLDALPLQLREFLADVAVLEHVEASTADALRQQNNSLDLIRQLAGLHPVVLIDEDQRSARLHPVLRDHLLDLLERIAPERVARSHRRAARLLAGSGDLQQAVLHALDGQQPGLAAGMIEQAGGLLLLCSEGVVRSRRLLQQLPQAVLRARPRLRLMQLMLQLLDGEPDGAVTEFARVLELATPARSARDELVCQDLLLAQAGLLLTQCEHDLHFSPWSALARLQAYARQQRMNDPRPLLMVLAFEIFFLHRHGPVERCERRVREIEALSAHDAGHRINPWIDSYQARNALARGELTQAEAILKGGLNQNPDLQDLRQESLLRLSHSLHGQIAYLRGHLDTALAHFNALTPPSANDPLEVLQGSCVGIAVCEFHQGQVQQALQRLEAARRFAGEEGLAHLALLLSATQIELLLRLGRLEEAGPLIAEADLSAEARPETAAALPWVTREALARALWRRWIVQGDTTQAAAIAFKLLTQAARNGQALGELRAQGMLAATRALEGAPMATRAALEEALWHSQRQGALQPWLELGPELPALLRDWLAAQRPPHLHPACAVAQQVIELWEARFHRRTALAAQRRLTPRESQIVFELGNTQSTKQIARSLALSPETVKHHLKNIFRKLGVGSRAEALRQARRQGLIP